MSQPPPVSRIECLTEVVSAMSTVRKSKGLAQDKLSLAAGYSHIYFGQMERGKSRPTRDAVENFIRILGITGSALRRIRWWIALSEITNDDVRAEILYLKRASLPRRTHAPPLAVPGRPGDLRPAAPRTVARQGQGPTPRRRISSS